MASQRGQYYETQYFHGQNLIIAWVKSFVHGQNHFSMGKFFLSMVEFICAWAKSFLAWLNSFVHGQNHFSMGKFFLRMGNLI